MKNQIGRVTTMKNMYQDIPDSETWQTIKPLHKGLSNDKKIILKKNGW